jgi:hypothetical protein
MSRPSTSMKLAALSFLAAGSMFLSSCADDAVTPPPPPPEVKSYGEFLPDMNYGGQTVRLLLADSLTRLLKATKDAGARPVTAAELNALLDNTNALWSDIATNKKISDKVSGFLDPNLVNQYRAWFDTVEVRSATMAGSMAAVTTEDGLYIPEMIEKTLMGAMMYAQAIDYLVNKVPVADNVTKTPGQGTAMEHNWDEAFGYFGASHAYTSQYFVQRRKPEGIDVNGNGTIDPSSERTFFHARYAATADTLFTTFTSQGLNLGNSIVKAFIDGRTAIAKNDDTKRDAARQTILSNWDKVIAGNAVRYAGLIKTRITQSEDFSVQWAELKGFVDMTQYWSGNALGARYNEVKNLVGSKPADITAAKLDQIVSIVKTQYGF